MSCRLSSTQESTSWSAYDVEKNSFDSSGSSLSLPNIPGSIVQKEYVLGFRSAPSITTDVASTAQCIPEDTTLPEKRYIRTVRHFRYTVFSIYRRLNVLIVVVNIIFMVLLALRRSILRLSEGTLGTICATNLLLAVLIRQELVINGLFTLFGSCPTSAPLRVRRIFAKVYHLGGVHSGAGIATVLWFAAVNYQDSKRLRNHSGQRLHARVWVINIILDVLLVTILISSYPYLRARFHNFWEALHRIGGWIVLGLFWARLIIVTDLSRQSQEQEQELAAALVVSPSFWMILVATISVVLPWTTLRRVPVYAEKLSTHATRFRFGYTNLPLCAAPRFSTRPLLEWHSFAGIPDADNLGFSVIVSKAGDWTSKMIDDPPRELWTKGYPCRGVLHMAPMFKKVVIVTTGSGIGPVLSLLYASRLNTRIIWSTPDPVSTYGQDIIDHVKATDKDALIINTRQSGRPDLVTEAYKLYKKSAAEAVFVISNPKVTRKVVYGLEARGIPIFAPIFDS